MKIGILTYYGVHNHGAVLQANALQSVLKSMGHDVSFLSFDRSYEFLTTEQAKKYKIGFASVMFYIKYMSEKGVRNVFYNIAKRKKLNLYRKKSFDVETKYSKFLGEVIVIGSDEVFSLEIGFNPMMYGLGLNSKKIISYAGSFGPTTIQDIILKGKSKEIQTGLEKVSAISVRDLNSKYIVKELCGRDVPMVCDPVILYGYKSEMDEFVPKDKDYILIYAYDSRMNDVIEVNLIQRYAKRYGMRLYSVGYFHKWCDKNINASPTELLGWIKNANCVITDTFHGAVMSIICNTKMAVKIRNNANKLQSLLSEYALEKQIICSFEELEGVIDNTIDFQHINEQLDIKRNEAIKYLKGAIEC